MIPDRQSDHDRKIEYEQIRSNLETERSSFITLWRNLNDYILPTRGRFQISDRNRGDRRSQNIVDTTPTLAARTTSAGMVSGITSPARPWFRLTTPDPKMAENGAVKEWLHVVTERMRWVLARSNFYNKCPTLYKDLAVFGTGGLLELEDDHNVIRFVDLPIGSFAVANGPDDRPAVITRAFAMTARQLVMEFGEERVSEGVRTNYRDGKNTETWYDVGHIIMRNPDADPDAYLASEAKAWTSCYYEIGAPRRENQATFLRESGFDEMPVMIPVWETTGEDVYGTDSPGITALGDVRQLQTMERRGLQGLEKMVNPPMTGPTALQSTRVSILPGDITYVDTRDGLAGFRAAHETQLRLDQLEGKENGVRGRINEAFYKDLFQMMQQMDDARPGRQPITAAEVYERHEEKLLMLGPVLEQLGQRLLDPVIHRTFNIMARRGFIPDPPPDVQAASLKIEYISTMHQAQKVSQMGGFNSLVSFVMPLAEAAPEALDKLNVDRLIEHVNDSVGNPPDVIRSQDEVDKIRQGRAKAQQEQQQAESLQMQADAAKKLSGADTSGQNALTDLVRSQNLPGGAMGAGGGNAPG